MTDPPGAETPELAPSFQAMERHLPRGYRPSRPAVDQALEFPGSPWRHVRKTGPNDNMKEQWIERGASRVAISKRQHKTVWRSRVIPLFSLSANRSKQR